MTSYNRVNGVYASENRHLLRDILKGEWGFEGFVMSDWIDGVASTVEAANSGLDIEMPIAKHFKKRKLKKAIAKGDISQQTIDDAVRRILRRKFEWGHFDETMNVPSSVIKSPEHRELALEAAREGMTLLKNSDSALPLNRAEISNLVVLGRSADEIRLGDLGSSRVQDDGEDAVSPLKGIIGSAKTVSVEYYADLSTKKARAAAGDADAVVVIASLGPNDEGEWIQQFKYVFPGRGGDRRDLSLCAAEVELIKRATDSNRRVIVVIQGGSAVTVEGWVDDVAAVLMAWYPGVKGGIAIGETLFGDNNPGGKTPVSWPVSGDQLYEFGSLKPSVVYDYYQGYRYYDKMGLDPLYPFGHGLSYTSFEYSNLSIDVETNGGQRSIIASFDVTNSGPVYGKEVAQLYVGYIDSAVERAVRDLKGFDKIALSPGETKRVMIAVPTEELRYWDVQNNRWVSDDITYQIEIGSSSRDIRLSGEVGGKS
jgi:beta-glucosidase